MELPVENVLTVFCENQDNDVLTIEQVGKILSAINDILGPAWRVTIGREASE